MQENNSQNTQEMHKKRNYDWLKPYQFKIGDNPNPGGRPKGSKSMKTYAKEYFETLNEDERVKFLNSLPSEIVWKMAEGNPSSETEIRTDKPLNITLNIP